MEAGTALLGRRFLALFVVVSMAASVMFLLADPADAGHIPSTGDVPDHCVKIEENDLGTEDLMVSIGDVSVTFSDWEEKPGDPGEYIAVDLTVSGLEPGQTLDWQLKTGAGEHEGSTSLNGTVTAAMPASDGTAISHVTVCVFEPDSLRLRLVKEWSGDDVDLETVDLILLIDDTPIEPLAEVQVQDGAVHEIREVVTGLPENCTYTPDPETPFNYTVDAEDAVDGLITLTIANTVECEEATTTTSTTSTTTTTVPEPTTTTTIGDEVLPTVITTSTTQAPATTTTTVEDEVLGTEVLPFTGADNDMLALLAGGLGLLGALVLASTRRIEDN